MPNIPQHVDVLVIGSGFSGLGMAIALKREGKRSFAVLEKGDSVGGTWRDNTYPGCACDVPSHLYCYSFAPNHDWSRVFAPQPEIRSYLERCAMRFGVMDHIHFGHEARRAEYDDTNKIWRMELATGEILTTSVVVSGQGALHIPSYPEIDGMETFSGDTFHSAKWPKHVDLKGRKVAVIGTGASAIQIVPSIADDVSDLVVFQRTPAWIQQKPDWKLGAFARGWLRYVPFAQRLTRSAIYWLLESRLPAMLKNKAPSFNEKLARRHLRRQVKSKALRDKLTPKYEFGCKRVLLSNDFYPALCKDHVELETDGITAIESNGIRTPNGFHEVDAIIYATGFAVTDPAANPFDIIGKQNRDMKAELSETAKAYLGISFEGFPNFFALMGPHTGLGHNSMIYMIECQIQHIMSALKSMDKNRADAIEVTVEAQDRFEAEMDAKMEGTVWLTGCSSWYADAKGRIATIWPDYTFNYKKRTKSVSLKDYAFSSAAES